MNSRKRIAVFVSFSGDGGVERVVTHLCHGFVSGGYEVDLLVVKDRGRFLGEVPPEVRIRKLGPDHTFLCLIPLVRYLRAERPAALLATKKRGALVGILARLLSRAPTRIAIRISTNLSGFLAGSSALRRWGFIWPMRLLYPRADQVIAISRGVADDVRALARLPEDKVCVIHNPVRIETIRRLAREEAPHPWFSDGGPPIILGTGRLTRQKDFETLIHAVAMVRKTRPCRLVILGEGPLRSALENLVGRLNLTEHVSLPGFVENPFAYMARARLFVLSSVWEGFGNVLVEAMAAGTPVVATDCPSGPREILEDGAYGPLVPPGDPEALGSAVEACLSGRHPAPDLDGACRRFSVERITDLYLAAMGLNPGSPAR